MGRGNEMFMSWYKIKREPADILFSNYIREKAGWRCAKCKKLCRVNGKWVAQLDASHYFSRSHGAVRFDERNVHALCATCHKRMGGYRPDEKGEYDLWMKEILGENGYNMLMFRANAPHKRDKKMELLYVKELIKTL